MMHGFIENCQSETNLSGSQNCHGSAKGFSAITYNGPAIWGGCVTRRQHRAVSRFFSWEIVTVQGGYGTCFCRHGTNFIACWRGRGTMLLSGREFLPVQVFDKWALAQCRGTKLSRRQKIVMVQNVYCGQLRVSGCNGQYKFVMVAGAKAKTVTSNLPILSVLAFRFVIFQICTNWVQSCRVTTLIKLI